MTAPTTRETMNGKPVFTVPAKSVLNLKSGFQAKLLCDGPTFSMGDACAYSCSFCYVPLQFQKLDRVANIVATTRLEHSQVVIRRDNALELLRSALVHKSGKPKFPEENDRRVVFSSPTVDVAANMDLVRETVAACKLILEHTNWQIRLLSKSNLLPKVAQMLCDDTTLPPWMDAAEIRERMIFGVSTGTLDDGLAKAFEAGTPLVSKRLESLHWLQDNGFRTYGMICPSLPHVDLDKFARHAAEAIRAEKCEHVWAEVINVRGESMQRTVAALRDAGFQQDAHALEEVSTDPNAWEDYNRATFLAHAHAYALMPGKLRYLTYTTNKNWAWWKSLEHRGAVLL